MRYARLHPDNLRGVAFMEAILPPAFPAPNYEALGPDFGRMMQALRTPEQGEGMVLDGNFFVENVPFQYTILRPLSDAEKDACRAPFLTRESRLPSLVFPRQLPIAGELPEVAAEIVANGEWLSRADIPKLLIHAEPGATMPLPVVEALKSQMPELDIVNFGAGIHCIQEDHPYEIGATLSDWLAGFERN